MPISVSAGLVSVIGGLFNNTEEPLWSNGNSLQKMHILTYNGSPNFDKPYLYETSSIVDDSVFVPEVGPEPGITLNRKYTSDQISVYVVREGDSLSGIAKMFDVSINTIKWGNDIKGNTVTPGQTLVILPISGVQHVVIKGDTLSSLAKKYKADIDEIRSYNDLEAGDLAPGSTVIIPDGEIFTAPASTKSSSFAGKAASGLKEFVGYYIRPIVGGKKTQGIHGHNGIDFGGSLGTPILAAADGEVIVSRSGGWNGGYGTYVVIKHSNDTQTLYAHNSSNTVSVGDVVKQGDIIGYMGSTGKSTGVHLHFEVRGAKNPF